VQALIIEIIEIVESQERKSYWEVSNWKFKRQVKVSVCCEWVVIWKEN